MSLERFTNNATTTLGSAAASGDTTITVSAGAGALFPVITAGQWFSATIFAAGSSTGTPNEIVRVTARTGDTMTVVRGQEGTSARAWNVGDIFANYPTAAFYNGAQDSTDAQAQAGNSAVDTGTANAGAVTLSPAPTALASILYTPIRVKKIGNANTSAYTLNVNGLGAQPVKCNGVALASGQLAASQVFEVVWDGAQFNLISTPAAIANANLAPMAAGTVKANTGGSSATPSDVPIASLLSAFGYGASVLSGNGYITIPVLVSGSIVQFILQFGINGAPSDGAATYSFPIPFPNQALRIIGGTAATNSGATNGNKVGAGITNNSQFFVYSDDTGVDVQWYAIGY